MRTWIRTITALILVASLPQSGIASAESLTIPAFTLKVEAEGGKKLALNENMTLIVNVESLTKQAVEISTLAFSARMPAHKHGMVTTPKVTKLSAATFRIEGVRLHMPGKWLLRFDVTRPDGETSIESSLDLP